MARDGDTHPEETTKYPLDPPAGSDKAREGYRSYQDEAASALFKACGGGKLVQAHATMSRGLVKQAEKFDEHFNTPFTNKQAKTILTAVESIERLGQEIERWHHLIYPNQRPTETK